ncbi:anti-sigma factor [Pseudooctadecabacter jejudonensis]|uniref:Anti-sigma-K factor rskA n=1 Tax=Pseudooctadecabacter jejudonensis TaxID=1391910 RepID=A0A1Y5RKF6_9RHOB|nr:anti-sigma factor [Pseudooctadecabacter jejudonensis]SLN19686.1 Anti-sigma-K factor rskA [Pseudooctadecabacter jejudonensis]
MTDDTIQPDDLGDDALAGEYALGLLTGDAHADASKRARTDIAFALKVNAWQNHFAAIAEAVDPVTPPRGLFRKIRRQAFEETLWGYIRQIGLIPAFVGAAAAALILYVTVQFDVFNTGQEPTPTMIAEMVAEDDTLVVAAAFTSDGRLFVDRRIGASAPDRSLELWLIAGDAAPVSLGVLAADQTLNEIEVPAELQDSLAGATLAISDEPQGGSPTGAPTGAVLAVGQITTL